jgi:hypothetical protein
LVKYSGEHIKLESARLYTIAGDAAPDLRGDRRADHEQEDGAPVRWIITVGAPDEKIRMLMERFEEGGAGGGQGP